MDASELRDWLFEFYSNTKDNNQYDTVSINTVRSIQFIKLRLDSKGRNIWNNIIAQWDRWFREENGLNQSC